MKATERNLIDRIIGLEGRIAYLEANSGNITGTDHGILGGLTDDDHTIYVLADGTRAMTGALTLSGDPTAALEAATKQYADGAGVTDHGALTGLGDHDHPQYTRAANSNVRFQYGVSDASSGISIAVTFPTEFTTVYGAVLVSSYVNTYALRDLAVTGFTAYRTSGSASSAVRWLAWGLY